MKLKKLLAMLLVIGMVVSNTPVGAFADSFSEDAGSSAPAPESGEGSDEVIDPAVPDGGEVTDPAVPDGGEVTDPAVPDGGEVTDPTIPGEVEEVVPPEVEIPIELPMDEATVALMERLQSVETLAEFWAALRALTEEEWTLLEQALDAEVYAQYREIAAMDAPITHAPIYVTEGGDDESIVPFTDVAPLLPPVSGPEPMRAARMALQSQEDIEGLELSKQVVKDGDNYKITLEAYVTGEFDSETITSTVPADIVLVLDESGSMAWEFSTQTTYQYNKYNKMFRDLGYSSNILTTELYSQKVDGSWVRVTGTRQNVTGQTYIYRFTRQGETTPFYTETYPRDTVINAGGSSPSIDIYTRTTVNENISRRDALKEGANNFIAAVRADNATIPAGTTGHRIAVVGFATGSAIRQPLVGCENVGITSAINNLGASGATNSAAGMGMAKNILAANIPAAGEKRNQVVIMFTDGMPTTGSSFSDTVANGAIGHAKTLKAEPVSGGLGASVYTIGIFAGANAADITTNTNKYMNYVSSNYPNASNMTTPGSGGSNKGFYLVAGNSEQLNTIFEKLSDVIETGDPAMEGLGTSTVLKDVITPYFQLASAAQDVKVYTADCTGEDGSGFVFGTPQSFGAATINVGSDGRTIDVSGFDYSENFVAKKTNGSYAGKKIIVEVPIRPIENFFGGNQVPTNTNTSGIYKDSNKQEAFDVPSVDVPLKYNVMPKNQTIYLSNRANVADMLDWTGYHEPNGINNAFVDLKFTVNSVDYTIPAGASGHAQLSGTVDPADCTDYAIGVQIVPTETGTLGALQNPTATAKVHVLKPTFNTQDAWSDYNGTVDLKQCVLPDSVSWNDFNTAHASIPAVTGNKPTLDAKDFTFKHMESNTDVAGTLFSPQTEANFQVASIKLNGTTFANAGPNKYFAFGTNSHAVTPDDPYHAPGRHFTIHMNRFDFVLTKAVTGSNSSTYPQSFIFAVTYGGDTFKLAFTSGGGQKTIKGLIYGKGTQITVTEDGNWSWRYAATAGNQSVSVTGNSVTYGAAPALSTPGSIAFTNRLENKQWLSGTAHVDNKYSAVAPASYWHTSMAYLQEKYGIINPAKERG